MKKRVAVKLSKLSAFLRQIPQNQKTDTSFAVNGR